MASNFPPWYNNSSKKKIPEAWESLIVLTLWTSRAVHFLVSVSLKNLVLRFPYLLITSASVCDPSWPAFGCGSGLPTVLIFPWDSRHILSLLFIIILGSSSCFWLLCPADGKLGGCLLHSSEQGHSLILPAEQLLLCAAAEDLRCCIGLCVILRLLVFFQSAKCRCGLHRVCHYAGVIGGRIFSWRAPGGFCWRTGAVCSTERFSGRCNRFAFFTENLFVPLRMTTEKNQDFSASVISNTQQRLKFKTTAQHQSSNQPWASRSVSLICSVCALQKTRNGKTCCRVCRWTQLLGQRNWSLWDMKSVNFKRKPIDEVRSGIWEVP